MKSISSILNIDFLTQKFNINNFDKCDKIYNIIKKYVNHFNNFKIENFVLFIEISSSVQKFEIKIRKHEIINELNNNLNLNINDIRVIISGKKNF